MQSTAKDRSSGASKPSSPSSVSKGATVRLQPAPNTIAYQSLQEELEASKKLLHLQQKDNDRYRDHVQMLELELQKTRALLEKRQKELNNSRNTILELEDIQHRLTKDLEETRVERSAHDTVVAANAVLTKRLDTEADKYRDLQQKLKRAHSDMESIVGSSERRIKELLEKSSSHIFEVEMLKAKVSNLEAAAKEQSDSNYDLQREVTRLKEALVLSEERRQDGLYRSRQTEYKTLSRSINLSDALQKVQHSYSLNIIMNN